jgi:putative transposase
MPRAPRRRLWSDAACYHLINRGHNREVIFADDVDRLYFLSLLARYRARYNFRLYHYCLMGNHFHLLLRLPQPRALSLLGAGLLRAYVHHANRRHGFVGHLFQGRFKSPAVEADEYLLSCGRYVERNPVEAGLSVLPWEYRWSSCRAYALGEADELLTPNPWYEALSPDPGRRQQLWREFLLGEDPKEAAVRREEGLVVGAGLARRTRRVRSRPMPRGPGRPSAGDISPQVPDKISDT